MTSGDARVAQPGRNCWRLARAGRVAFFVDAEAYFAAVADALENARSSVFLLGWTFDSRTRLRHRDAGETAPRGHADELGPLLELLARRNHALQVRILAWDFAMIFGVESGYVPVFRPREKWARRIEWELDSEHPWDAAPHQKIVVIDDRVAFVSGMDLSTERWDTREHRPHDPRRVDAGRAYGPYHDVAMLVDGDAAAALGELARDRWHRATGRRAPMARLRAAVPALRHGAIGRALDRVSRAGEEVTQRARSWRRRVARHEAPEPGDPWPSSAEPAMRDVDVAIARTEAAYLDRPAIQEVEALWLDAIASARRCIYLENQYFTSAAIADALAKRLAEPEGPEVVIVQPLSCAGWLEQASMGILRGERFRQLAGADAFRRLRVLHPVAEDGAPIYVHAKVLVVDDALVRIGSANVSNRSLRLDTECDVVIEALGRDDVASRIRELRDGLVAEHLGADERAVSESVARTSLRETIDALAGGPRRLEPLPTDAPSWLVALIPTRLADPEMPDRAAILSERLAADGRPSRVQIARGAAFVAVLTVLALAWELTPFGFRGGARALAEGAEPFRAHPLAPFVAIAAFLVGGAVAFPMSVLLLACELTFGPWLGSALAFVGAASASAIGYAQGRIMGRHWLRRLGGRRLNRVSRRLARHGVLTIAAARLIPFMPWSLTSLAAGASHVRPLDYALGTLLGLVPAILSAAILSDAATHADLRGAVELGVFTALLGAGYLLLRARLRRPSALLS